MDYTAEAAAYFSNDIFATQTTGAVVEEAQVGYARCSLHITPSLLNANGTVMGGAIFTLADLAFAAASNVGGNDTVAASSSIDYYRAAGGEGTLYAEARCKKNGRNLAFYEITVTDDAGRDIAVVATTGFRRGTEKK